MTIFRALTTLTLLVALSLPFTGCMPAVGQPFPVHQVRQLEIGKTTKTEVRQMFGEPWRTGLEDGFRTWTYGHYTMKHTRDLVVRFDKENRVKSYSFSSSFPEDAGI